MKCTLSKCLELTLLRAGRSYCSLVQVLEELLVALDGLLVLLDLLVMEFGLVDLVVLQALQLLPLLQRNNKQSTNSQLTGG